MVRTRIAPSPTGEDIHIGNLYTALINWTFAKKHGGQFIIRIEDTDRERYVKGAEQKILATLKAFGLNYDEGPDKDGPYAPYRQSERLALYKKYAEELIQKSHAYYCFCSRERLDELRKQQIANKQVPRYDRYCLQHETWNTEHKTYEGNKQYVIRLKVPENKEIIFHDVIRGEIKFQSRDIDDQVLIKSDGYPTYHMAVVVDDHLMEISHIIRAEEWISSTPKHVLLYEAFGWNPPVFAHLPILRNPDKSKLSKRKNPVWASWYLEQGYFPEAVLNYLALMGWSHPQQKEIFSLEEFIQVFDLKDMQAVGPAFDPVKLEWMNGAYIRQLKVQSLKFKVLEFIGNTYSEEIVEKTIPLIQERIKKLSDYLPLCGFFFEKPKIYEADLSAHLHVFEEIKKSIEHMTLWNAQYIGKEMQKTVQSLGIKNSEFFMLLRIAITGKKVSPPLNESMEILGKEECLRRVNGLTS